MTFVPPSNGVSNIFHIRTEVAVKFRVQVSRLGWCECRKIVEYVFALIFIQ